MKTWQESPNLHGRVSALFGDCGWCQNHFAETSKGTPVHWMDDNAACFCLLGAIYKTYRTTRWWPIVMQYLRRIFHGQFAEAAILDFNDNPARKEDEIKAWLKKHKF